MGPATDTASAVTDGWATVGDLQLHYRTSGDQAAPSVVVLHGIMGHVREWDTLTSALAPDFAVTALDQRGHGESDWARDYAATSMAADVVAVLDQLQIGRTHLIGHSMGGAVALLVAAQQPDRVGKLVILDVGPGSFATEAVVEMDTTLRTLAGATYADYDQPLSEWLAGNPLAREGLMRHYVTHALVRGDDGLLRWRFDGARLGRFMDGSIEDRLSHAVDTVTAPTLVVGGEHSPVLAPHAAEQMVARLARGQLAEIPGAGHDLGVEQPERVAAVVRDFLLAPRYGVT
jgi:esterase